MSLWIAFFNNGNIDLYHHCKNVLIQKAYRKQQYVLDIVNNIYIKQNYLTLFIFHYLLIIPLNFKKYQFKVIIFYRFANELHQILLN